MTTTVDVELVHVSQMWAACRECCARLQAELDVARQTIARLQAEAGGGS